MHLTCHTLHAYPTTCWCHLWRHLAYISHHVITSLCLHHHLRHLANVIALLVALTVDFWGWFNCWLFPNLTFCNLGAPCPVLFCIDFIFQSIFVYLASKWRIRTSLLFIATIVADNPTNVFAIFFKCLGHNIETCYQRNKSTVSIFVAIIANIESIQPMDLVSAKSKSSRFIITISIVDLQNIIANTIRMVGNASYSSSFSVLSGMSLSLWLMDFACCNHMTPYSSLFS